MPWWMRYPKQEEADDGSQGGGGGGGGALDPGAAGGTESVGEASGGAQEPIETGMLAAIRSSLAPDAGVDADAGAGNAVVAERVRDPATGRFVEKPAVEAPQAPATAAPKAEAKPAAGAQPAVDPAKTTAPKKADDFALTAAEKKTLSPGEQGRVHQIHKMWKESETHYNTQLATLTEQNQAMQQARESITGVLTETQTTPEDLTQLLSFNQMVKTGNLKGALQMVDAYREQLHRAIGQEGPGVDLLKEFPDLAQRVTNNEIHREDAVEIANARRRDQALQRQGQEQSQQAQQVQSIKQQQDDAMAAIDRWSQQTAQKDIDWTGKESKIIAKLDKIVKTYPPNLWLQRLQEEYEATPAQAQQQQPNTQQRSAEVPGIGSNIPLRASGARGGAAQPASMEEAVMRKLGIATS